MVKNFAKGFPWYKKLVVNLLNFLGDLVVRDRENYLRKKDCKRALKCLKRGDIFLAGGLRRLSKYFITGPLTHSLLYIGNSRFIHSTFDGVSVTTAKEVFREYDAFVILRAPAVAKRSIDLSIAFASEQLGKPFNFDRDFGKGGFYCSELLYFALQKGGIDFKVVKDSIKFGDLEFHVDVHPMHYVTSGLKVIYYSRNLRVNDGRVELIEEEG